MRRIFKVTTTGDFPGGPAVKTVLPLQGTWVQSLVGELRSHMPRSTAKKKKKNLKTGKESDHNTRHNTLKNLMPLFVEK